MVLVRTLLQELRFFLTVVAMVQSIVDTASRQVGRREIQTRIRNQSLQLNERPHL